MTDSVVRIRCFEDALAKTGWGPYHKFVVAFSAMCSFCSTAAIATISFSLPPAACDLNMRKDSILWVKSILYIGMCCGGVILGIISDILYRKCMIPTTLILLFIANFGSGFSCEISMFMIFTYLTGFSVIGNLNSTKINLIEILPLKSRGYYIILVDMFGIAGYLVSACINWAMKARVPQDFDDSYVSWRMMYGFVTGLSLLCACLTGLLQPSPRVLLSKKMDTEAFLVLKYIYAVNNSEHADNFKVLPNEIQGHIDTSTMQNVEGSEKCKECCLFAGWKLYKLAKKLWNRKYLRVLLLIAGAKISLFAGFPNVWLSKSLQNELIDTKCKYTSMELFHLPTENAILVDCYSIPDAALFRDYFIIGAGWIAGLFVFSYAVDSLGRRIPLMMSLLCCGLLSINVVFTSGYPFRLIFFLLYIIAFGIANSLLDVMIIENVPTSIRCACLGLSNMPAAIVSAASRILIDTQCKITFFVCGGIAIAASVLAYFLPELKRQPMVE